MRTLALHQSSRKTLNPYCLQYHVTRTLNRSRGNHINLQQAILGRVREFQNRVYACNL
jgi:hypothetical protein